MNQQNDKHLQWQRNIDNWRETGLSQREYCSTHHLKLSTFQYYRNILRQSPSGDGQMAHVLVRRPEFSETESIAIESGVFTVRILPGFDKSHLQEILSVLKEI